MLFIKTKQQLTDAISNIKTQFKVLQTETNCFWKESLLDDSSIPMHNELLSACATNESLLLTLLEIQNKINFGEINNYREYEESDLAMVQVAATMHWKFGQMSFAHPSESIETLKNKFAQQLQQLESLINYYPEDLAINYKTTPEVICNYPLDFYQLIYLAINQSNYKIQSICFSKNIHQLTQKKTVAA